MVTTLSCPGCGKGIGCAENLAPGRYACAGCGSRVELHRRANPENPKRKRKPRPGTYQADETGQLVYVPGDAEYEAQAKKDRASDSSRFTREDEEEDDKDSPKSEKNPTRPEHQEYGRKGAAKRWAGHVKRERPKPPKRSKGAVSVTKVRAAVRKVQSLSDARAHLTDVEKQLDSLVEAAVRGAGFTKHTERRKVALQKQVEKAKRAVDRLEKKKPRAEQGESTFTTGRKVVRYLNLLNKLRSMRDKSKITPAMRQELADILDSIPGGLGTVNRIGDELDKKARARTPGARRAEKLLNKLEGQLAASVSAATAKAQKKAHQDSLDARQASDDLQAKQFEALGADRERARAERDAAKKKEQDAETKAPGVKLSDIPFETAFRAHSGTSMVPDKRALQEQKGYVAHMERVWGDLKALMDKIPDGPQTGSLSTTTPEKRKLVDAARNDYIDYTEQYPKKYTALLQGRAGIVSAMIAGPSKFPGRRMEKRNRADQNRTEAFLAWSRKAVARMESKLRTGGGPISSSSSTATQDLQAKIDKAKKRQEMLRDVNKIVRSKDTFETRAQKIRDRTGFKESTVQSLMMPGFGTRRGGFPAYELTNNNANIKRMEQRIKSIAVEKSVPVGDDQDFPGGTVTQDASIDRIQILFDDKPPEEMRTKLKRRGFRWAPSIGVWQRNLNIAGRQAVEDVLGIKLGGG